MVKKTVEHVSCVLSPHRDRFSLYVELPITHKSGVVASDSRSQEDKICLDDHELLDEPVQEEIMSRQKVLAVHFLSGELSVLGALAVVPFPLLLLLLVAVVAGGVSTCAYVISLSSAPT